MIHGVREVWVRIPIAPLQVKHEIRTYDSRTMRGIRRAKICLRLITQYLRRPPIHSPGWFLTVGERGGFSFDQRGYTP